MPTRIDALSPLTPPPLTPPAVIPPAPTPSLSRPSSPNPMPDRILPTGTPSHAQLQKAANLIRRFNPKEGSNKQIRQATLELEYLLEDLLNRIINLPQAPRLICKVEPSSTSSSTHHLNCYQDIPLSKGQRYSADYSSSYTSNNTSNNIGDQRDNKDGVRYNQWGPRGIPIDHHDVSILLARYAQQYRQSFAKEQLFRLANGLDHDLSKTKITMLTGINLHLWHPAQILTDPTIMGHDFWNNYLPKVSEGTPIHSWTKPQHYGSHLTLAMTLPDMIAEALIGEPLTRIVEIPDHLPGEITSHDSGPENRTLDDQSPKGQDPNGQISKHENGPTIHPHPAYLQGDEGHHALRQSREAYNSITITRVTIDKDKGQINIGLSPIRQTRQPGAIIPGKINITDDMRPGLQQGMANFLNTAEIV